LWENWDKNWLSNFVSIECTEKCFNCSGKDCTNIALKESDLEVTKEDY
jgi:hypothetical protein